METADTWAVATGQLDDASKQRLLAWWSARSLLWAPLTHEPRTGDLSIRSIEELFAVWALDDDAPWPSWDDRLTRLLRFAEEAIDHLLKDLRTSIRRTHTMRRPDRVKELDERCLQWLGQQPGRHIREKIGYARGCLCLEREWHNELIENRVLISLAMRLADLAGCYHDKINHGDIQRLYEKAVSWRTQIRRDGLSDLRLNGPVTPNNVLLGHRQYGIIWRSWERLRSFDVLYHEDLESNPAQAWRDLLLLRLLAELNRHPSVRIIHDYVEPPCVLRRGGASSAIPWKGIRIRYLVLQDGKFHEYSIRTIGSSRFSVVELIGGEEKRLLGIRVKTDVGRVEYSHDGNEWHCIGPGGIDIDKWPSAIASELTGDKAVPAPGRYVGRGAVSIGAHLLGAWPIICSDRCLEPMRVPIASGVTRRMSRREDGESRFLIRASSGRHLIDQQLDQWVRLADLLNDESEDPITLAPHVDALSRYIEPAAGHVFAYGMPDGVSEFQQAKLRSVIAGEFQKVLPVWYSIAVAEALQASGKIKTNKDHLVFVIDLMGDHPCMTLLTRAEDGWEHHQPLINQTTESCGDRQIARIILKDSGYETVAEHDVDLIIPQISRSIAPRLMGAPEVRDISSVRKGMEIYGRIVCEADCGLIIDIGVGKDALLHVSRIPDLKNRHPKEAFARGTLIPVRVVSVNVLQEKIGLELVKEQAAIRLQHANGDQIVEVQVSRDVVSSACEDFATNIARQLHSLANSPRSQSMVTWLRKGSFISASVVMISHCCLQKTRDVIFRPIIEMVRGVLPMDAKVSTLSPIKIAEVIGSGCQLIAERQRLNMATWYEWLPPLAFEVRKDGRPYRFPLVAEGSAAVPVRGGAVLIPIMQSFILPAGKAFYQFPLFFGEEEGGIGFSARLDSPVLPQNTDVACRLDLMFDYSADEPYRLLFVPINSSLPRIPAKWRRTIERIIDDAPSPQFPQPLSWSDLSRWREAQDKEVDLLAWLEMRFKKLRMTANGYNNQDQGEIEERTYRDISRRSYVNRMGIIWANGNSLENCPHGNFKSYIDESLQSLVLMSQMSNRIAACACGILACVHKDAPPDFIEWWVHQIVHRRSDDARSIGLCLGDLSCEWQNTIYRQLVSDVRALSVRAISYAIWRNASIIEKITLSETKALLAEIDKLLGMVQPMPEFCRNVDGTINNAGRSWIRSIAEPLELLLGLLRTRNSGDRETRMLLQPHQKISKDLAVKVDCVDIIIAESRLPLISRVHLDVVKPDGVCSADLIYALRLYLTGDDGANAIHINSIADAEE